MFEISPSIKVKLDKNNIPESRYLEEFKQLIDIGYSEKQANHLILRQSSANTVQSILAQHMDLLTNFTPEQIVKIAGHHGGLKNINTVKDSFVMLKELQFTAEQIVKIVGHDGGSKNIEAVKNSYHVLQQLQFTPEQIAKIAGHSGGSINIEAVKNSCHELQQLQLTAEQIVKIAGNNGGSKNIEAVKQSWHELQHLQLTAEQIVKIAGHIGGSKNIEAVKNSCYELQQLQFTAEQIVKIAGNNGGSKNIEAVKNSFLALQQLQLTAEQIVKIVGHDGGSKNIGYLLRLSQWLVNSPEGIEAFESKKDEILFALSRKSGHVLLDKSLSHYNTLAARGFTLKNIIRLEQSALQKTIALELNRRMSSGENGLNHADWQLFCELFNPLQAETEQEMFPIPPELLNEYCDEYSNKIEEVIQSNNALQKSDSSALQKESLFSRQKHVLDTDQFLSDDIVQRPKRKA